jgi:hypothetical protein
MTEHSDQVTAQQAHAAPIVMRSSWPRIMASALALPTGAAFGFFLAFASGPQTGRHDISAEFVAALVVYFAVVTTGSAWLQRRNCLVLGPCELTVRSGLRAHVLGAADVQAVTLERFLGTRTVKLWLAGGGYQRVAVAGRTQGLFRENFDRDFHLIGDWWLANRGAHWQPSVATGQASVPLDLNWNPNT